MGEQTKNLLIGIFVLAATFLLIAMVFFLKPSIGDMKKTLHARFSNINQITVGTRLLYAGKPIGEVVSIQLIDDSEKQPTDILGRRYVYELTIKYDSHYDVYTTDQVSVQTSGLLGEKSIAVNPIKPKKGIKPQLIGSQSVYANSVDPIENTFEEVSELANNIQRAVNHVDEWFLENANSLSLAVKSFDEMMKESKKTFLEINQNNVIGHTHELVASLKNNSREVQVALEQMRDDQVFENVGKISDSLARTSTNVEEITNQVAIGKGSIGKLVNSDDFYIQISSFMGKIDTMMNDINHYGVLFNLNKKWQRERTAKAALLNSLSTPSEFKDYFEREIDTVSTSMERISMLINKAKEQNKESKLFNNGKFKKEFRNLIGRVDALYDELKLYNESIANDIKEEGCAN